MPYFVLPDGTTEVDLHVEQYVPYLLDDGDTAKFKACTTCIPFETTLDSNIPVHCMDADDVDEFQLIDVEAVDAVSDTIESNIFSS